MRACIVLWLRVAAGLAAAALAIMPSASIAQGAPRVAASPSRYARPATAARGVADTPVRDVTDPQEAALLQRLTHTPLQPVYTLYTVRPGDTVEGIARRFHDVAWLLRQRNGGLWSLRPGQQIRVWQWPFGIPYYVTRTHVIDHPQFYIVQAGDTLEAIAARLHTDVATLVAQNGLSDADLIYAGQRLVLHHVSARHYRVLVPGVPASRLHTGLLLTDVANLTDVDAALVKALAWHETGWAMVRGSSGEIGIMQIMPDMASWVQRELVGYTLDPNVPVNNILEGTLLLGYYLDATHGDTHKALALYHSGDTYATPRNGIYIRAVLALRDYFYHHPRAGF